MSETLFYAKKIVTRGNDRWVLNINLIFDEKEFSMTNTPITIDECEVGKLCPGADTKTESKFVDTVAIDSPYQFASIFGPYLTDEVPELLCDVYNTRSWNARIIDTEGNETTVHTYLTNDFISEMAEILHNLDRFWMEIRIGSTRFKKDWSIKIKDEMTVFCNIRDGFRPIGASQAQTIIDSLIPVRFFSDKENFEGTVMKSGNSLVLKVTDQCRRMGIDVGDNVSVTLDVNTPEDSTDLRVFASQNWSPIKDVDELCHRNGCDLNLVRKFLDDFHIIGTLEQHSFRPSHPGSKYAGIFDHLNFFRDKDGCNLLVSQPYSKESKLKDAEEWARKNGCIAEEHREYSWHFPPDTTLLIFKKKVNPDWNLPKIDKKKSF